MRRAFRFSNARNDSYDELMSDSNAITYVDYMVTIKNDVAQYVPPPEQDNSTIELERYNEKVKGLEERKNSKEFFTKREEHSDSQVRGIIVDRNENVTAFEKQELLKHARDLKPLNENLVYACKLVERIRDMLGSKPRSNAKNDRIQHPSSRSKKTKVESQLRTFKCSLNKNNFVSDCNMNVKNVVVSNNFANDCLSYFDYSKVITGQREKLINFVSKFNASVRFGNDHFAAIMGYGEL
nr:integrase, catalytic region, zinc finger, CCHC-type, peptidase aspartic, catalytic [Tanacetum cinerariifolium]GEZ20434.1 integrase, catalytic region, zinc finger, CCHC-type, peptidase aspartic, catalytic [Tanacetum cinerariifolium]